MSDAELEFDQVDGWGFGLLELTIVASIIVVLTAAAAPLYRDYVLEAKTVEGKLLATSLWTSVTANALGGCGNGVPVSTGYARAGLSSTGATTPARWAVTSGGSNSITMDCGPGGITPEGDVFTVGGTAADVSSIRVTLRYVAATSPAVRLRCSTDGGSSFADC